MKPKLATLLRGVTPRGSRTRMEDIRSQMHPQGILQTTPSTLREALGEAALAYYTRVDDGECDCDEDPDILDETYAWRATQDTLRARYNADREPALFIHLLMAGGPDSLPAQRAPGSGRGLLARLEAKARAQGVRWLVGVSTKLDGERSPLGFWQRMGFEVAFVDPWYGKPEDQAIIVKRLS